MLKKKFFKTKDECEITFELDANGAETVALVCETNDWEPMEMKLSKKYKAFRTKVRMPKNDRFQFRYLVDGENWVNDESADDFVINEFGGQNSIVDTTPAN